MRRRMTKFTKTPDHNQNTLSGGFESDDLCTVILAMEHLSNVLVVTVQSQERS